MRERHRETMSEQTKPTSIKINLHAMRAALVMRAHHTTKTAFVILNVLEDGNRVARFTVEYTCTHTHTLFLLFAAAAAAANTRLEITTRDFEMSKNIIKEN